MNKKLGKFFIILGFLFLLNTVFGRYIVLPGYLVGLEAGGNTLDGASQIASPWKIARYLLWAYSFKLGIYFVLLGAIFRTEMPSARKWVVGVGGFVYIGFAYMPLPEPTSIIFGIAGGIVGLALLNAVGAVLGWLGLGSLHQPFDMISMLGFLILMGTVVNNPILIVDRAMQHMKEAGSAPIDAVREAVASRLRPIAMSTLTTICGLSPLVFIPGAGTERYHYRSWSARWPGPCGLQSDFSTYGETVKGQHYGSQPNTAYPSVSQYCTALHTIAQK